jgi:hypothetical protein
MDTAYIQNARMSVRYYRPDCQLFTFLTCAITHGSGLEDCAHTGYCSVAWFWKDGTPDLFKFKAILSPGLRSPLKIG